MNKYSEKEIIYDKLVRDLIPEIIEKSGKEYEIHIADAKEYESKLLEKLKEEAEELIAEPCIDEIADVLEVMDAIKAHFGFSDEEIEKCKMEKYKKRGGFNECIILDKVVNTQ